MKIVETSIAADETAASSRITDSVVTDEQLLAMRSWTARRLTRLLAKAQRENLIRTTSDGKYHFTERGAAEAQRVVRNHRLWEIFLITYADIAPSHVDRDADMIEHVLEPELIRELEFTLSERFPEMTVPPSPHTIKSPAGAGS